MDIIIVDDDIVSLTMLKQLTEKLPACKVKEFAHPALGLAWCKHNDPDLIIVDHLMPAFDGIEFTRRLRTFPGRSETPVLMVTASDEPEVRNSALKAGVNDLLTKPYDFAQLQPRATNMLALRASQRKEPEQNVAARRKSLLDANLTLERLAGDEMLLGKVAVAFIRTAPQLLASISSALGANDLKRTFVQAHTLKGAVAAFEAPVVFNSVLKVERHAKNDDAPAAAAAFRLAQELVARLLKELMPLAPPGAELEALG
jgi:CheY-like chemotaxis protein